MEVSCRGQGEAPSAQPKQATVRVAQQLVSRAPGATPEGGDPKRSVGPADGRSGFAYFFQEKSKPL